MKYLPLLCLLSIAWTKSGTTYLTDGSISDCNSAISDATAGDTVRIPSGTYANYGASAAAIAINKRITLAGAGTAETILNLSATADYPLSISSGGDGAVICGMTINQNGAAILNIQNVNGWRVTDVKFVDPLTGSHPYQVYIENGYGLFDHCTFWMAAEQGFIRGKTNAWNLPDAMGTTNAVYFEDCIFGTDGGYVDANSHAQVVWRYCDIFGSFKFDSHGIYSNFYPPGSGRSARFIESYCNRWIGAGFFYCLHIRGGTGMAWSNSSPVSAGNYIILEDFNLSQGLNTVNDYPINDQVGVGKDPKVAASSPLYLWGNNKEGSLWTWTTNYPMTGLIENNRDVFEQTSGAFNGSAGVGIGTTSTRTGLSPSLAGVGFWDTDTGSLFVWNGSAWTNKYTPLTYPHPLRGAAPTVVASARRGNAGKIRKP